jgi:hypothetical protein
MLQQSPVANAGSDMMARMCLRKSAIPILLIGLVLALTGCAYRLPAFAPPSQELVRIVASTPEQYTVQVNTGTVNDYEVPNDGRIKVGIPPYRSSCGVYLFNAVKVGGFGDPLKSWTVSINRNGEPVRTLSLRATQKLPTDDAGYRIVRIGN